MDKKIQKYIFITIAIIALSVSLIIMMRSLRETFIDFNQRAVYNVVEPILSLDTKQCSKDCCELGKGSNLSCLNGCICKNDNNSYMISSRGGNRTNRKDDI